jgi:hypothetical protein
MTDATYNTLVSLFRILVWSLALAIIAAYMFSVKFLGVVVYSSAALFVIHKLTVTAGLLGMALLAIYVFKTLLPKRVIV